MKTKKEGEVLQTEGKGGPRTDGEENSVVSGTEAWRRGRSDSDRERREERVRKSRACKYA